MLEKEKALEMALHQIEKQFGKGAVMRLGEAAEKMSFDVIPTGCLSLDIALGIGGIPEGGLWKSSALSLQGRLQSLCIW